MKIRVKNKKNKSDLQLSFVKICGFSLNLQNGQMDSFLSVYTLSEVINFWPSAATLDFNPLNAELNPICHLLALLGVHHFLHVSRISVKSLTLKLLMSYIYGAPILDVSRSHTTTHHSR